MSSSRAWTGTSNRPERDDTRRRRHLIEDGRADLLRSHTPLVRRDRQSARVTATSRRPRCSTSPDGAIDFGLRLSTPSVSALIWDERTTAMRLFHGFPGAPQFVSVENMTA